MRSRSLFLCILLLASLSGCGSTDDEPVVPVTTAPATGELLVRRTGSILELVRLDIATGAVGQTSKPLPYEATKETFPVLWHDDASGRTLVEVGTKLFALDPHEGELGTWRTLADHAYFIVPSADASLVAYSTPDSAKNETTLHVVRFGGEKMLDVTVPTNPVDSYPKPTLSPTGQWVLVSRALGQLEAYEIPASGPASAAILAPGKFNLLCKLASTFIGYDTGTNEGAWFDARFQPVPAPFSTKLQLVTSQNDKRCLFQFDVQQSKPVVVFDDRSVSPGFVFDGRSANLVDVQGDKFLSMVPFTMGPSVTFGTTATVAAIATYVPAPPIPSAPEGFRFSTSMSLGAHRFAGQRLSVVVQSEWATVTTDNSSLGTGVNAPTILDSYVEVFSVDADGSSPSTVRLATVPGKDTNRLSRFVYRFTNDGRSVYWMGDGGLKVRDVTGGEERTIGGDYIVGAARD